MRRHVDHNSRTQAGNIFFAIFGAIAIVSLLGAGITTFVSGPMSASVTVTRQSITENQMVLAAQTALMNAAAQPSQGDCDSDGFVEPVAWRDPGASPHPTGGGLIPGTIAVPKRDPWGTDYGYCVWDHGPTLSDAACGGSTALRLAGANSTGFASLAIISAGPDRTFDTTCRNFDVDMAGAPDAAAADQNHDGDLLDVGDFPIIAKNASASDDIIFSYTYDQAIAASGDLWTLVSANATAALAKNLEVDGGASFTGSGDFIGVTGDTFSTTSGDVIDLPVIKLPDAATYNPVCDASMAGVIRTNLSGGAGGTYADPALVQQTDQIDNSNATITRSFATLPVVGNTVIVLVSGASNGTAIFSPSSVAVTDNQGNTYSLAAASAEPTIIDPYSNGQYIQNVLIYYARVTASAGTFTVTVTDSDSPHHYKSLQTLEVSGIAPLNPVDSVTVSTGAASYTSDLTLTASSPIAQEKEFAIGVMAGIFATNGGSYATAGWTPLPGTTDLFMPAYKITSATETLSHQWNNPDYNVGAMVSFRAAGSSGGGGAGVPVTAAFETSQGNNASGTTLTTASFDSTGAEGIVVFAKHEGAVTPITISDNKGTSFNALTKLSHSNNDLHAQLFWANLSAPGTNHTVTMTLGAGRAYRDVSVWLLNADGTTIALEGQSSAEDTLASYPYAPGITTTAPAALVGANAGYDSQNYFAMEGWALDDESYDNAKIHRNQANPGHFSPVVYSDNGGDSAFVAAAFKDAAASPSTPVTGSSIYLVQKSSLEIADGADATITLASPSTSGNTIIVPYKIWSGVVTDVYDNKGNTYTEVVSSTEADEITGIWYANNIVTDGTPIEVTVEVNTGWGWRRLSTGVMEFAGISDATNPVEQTGTLQQTGGTTSTVATSSPKIAEGQLSIAVLSPEFTGSLNIEYDPAWSLAFMTNNPPINYTHFGVSSVYKISGDTGAESHTWTHSAPSNANDDVSGSIATFLPASYSGGGSCSNGGGGGGGGTSTTPTLIASTTSAEENGVVDIAKPSGVAPGDVLILGLSADNGQNMTVPWPSGFVQVELGGTTSPDGQGWAVAYKIVDGLEPASFTFTIPATSGTAAIMTAYSNVDTTSPIGDTAILNGTSLGSGQPWTITGPSVTTTVADSRVVWFAAADPSADVDATDPVDVIPPAGFTERNDIRGGTGWTWLATADSVVSAVGATGALTGSATSTFGSINAGFGVMALVLNPGDGTTTNPAVFIQKTAISSSNGTSPATLSLPSNAGVGNTIIVPLSMWGSSVTSVTDNQGNSYTRVGVSQEGATTSAIYAANNISGGALTVSVAHTGGELNFGVMEFAGLSDINLVDVTGTHVGQGGNSTTVTTSTNTTSDFGLAVAVAGHGYNGTMGYAHDPAWTEAFTQNDTATYSGHSSVYRTIDGTQSVSHTWTHQAPPDTYQDNTGLVVTFHSASGQALSCPAGYTLHNLSCYKPDPAGRTWADARTYCQADGADLLVINDEAERAYIQSIGYYLSWVGYNRSSGSWTWNTPSTWDQTVNRQCVEVGEGGFIQFDAPVGGTITGIDFASYGTPAGACGGYTQGSCHAANSVSYAQTECVGNATCGFYAANANFGDPCSGTLKYMYAQARTSRTVWGTGEPNQGSNCAAIWQDTVPDGHYLADEPCNSTAASTICEVEAVQVSGGGGGGPITIGQMGAPATGGETLTSTFGTNPSEGSAIVVPLTNFGRLNHVSDNAGNSYAVVANALDGVTGASIYVATNIKLPPSGNLIITAQYDQYHVGTMRPFEVMGIDPVDFRDRVGEIVDLAGGANTTITASGTNRLPDELAVAATYPRYNYNPLTPFSVAGSWTSVHTEDNCMTSVCHSSAYKILSATENTSHTWTHPAPNNADDDVAKVLVTLRHDEGVNEPISNIQQVSVMGSNNGSSNTLQTSFSKLPVAGNAIVVFITNETNSSDLGNLDTGDVVDNQGNTYVRVIDSDVQTDWVTNTYAFVAYDIAPSTGTFTVTATTAGPVTGRIGAVEVQGLAANGVEATGAGLSGYVTSYAIVTSTPTTTANTIVLAATSDYTGGVHAKEDGWSYIYNESDNGLPALSVVAKLHSAIAPVSHTWSFASTRTSAIIMAFRTADEEEDCSGSGGNSLLQICKGTGAWESVGGSGGGSGLQPGQSSTSVCNNASTSTVRYNTSTARPEYCNGTSWMPFVLNESGVVLTADPVYVDQLNSRANTLGDSVTITITNRGSETSGTLSYSFTGTNPGAFDHTSYSFATTCTPTTTLAPGESCTKQVAAHTNTNGPITANFQVTDGSATVLVPLSGAGSQNLACEPGVLGWGGIVVTCLNSTTPLYVISPAGCGTSPAEPTCTNSATNGANNDPDFANDTGGSLSVGASDYMSPTSYDGAIQTATLLAYGGTRPAATYCNNLVKDGYSDWYLPTVSEWRGMIYPLRTMLRFNLGAADPYWTSTNGWNWGYVSNDMYNFLIDGNISNNEAGAQVYNVRCLRKHGASAPTQLLDTDPYQFTMPAFYTTSLNTVVASAQVYVIGINTTVPVTISGPGSPQFRIHNGTSWSGYTTTGTISNMNQIQISATSPTVAGTERAITLNIGTSKYTYLLRAVQTATKRIFVTSTTQNGNLGGFAGADAICQARTSAYTSPWAGTYYALLGGMGVNAFDRIPWNWNRLDNRNSVKVADDMAELRESTIDNEALVNRDESNTTRNSTYTWTGMVSTMWGYYVDTYESCSMDGTAGGQWRSNNSGRVGVVGNQTTMGTDWMQDYSQPACNSARRLYCIGPF